jgi:hypothetical protein
VRRREGGRSRPPSLKLEHVAIWAVGIELMRTFYEKYFDARSKAVLRGADGEN